MAKLKTIRETETEKIYVYDDGTEDRMPLVRIETASEQAKKAFETIKTKIDMPSMLDENAPIPVIEVPTEEARQTAKIREVASQQASYELANGITAAGQTAAVYKVPTFWESIFTFVKLGLFVVGGIMGLGLIVEILELLF